MPVSVLIFFMIVVGIPILAGVGSKMFRDWLAHKRELGQALNSQTAEKSAQYAAHTERLEQRVRVLERIVTDKGIVVAEEIDQLRDRPPVN
jgi:hypothetical protein